MNRGSSGWLMCGTLLATYWKDNRMYYLSTFHTPAAEENLTINQRKNDGADPVLNITPTALGYVAYMGGVDRLDQMSRVSKTKKASAGTVELKLNSREISIYNAYILKGTAVNHNAANKRKRFIEFLARSGPSTNRQLLTTEENFQEATCPGSG